MKKREAQRIASTRAVHGDNAFSDYGKLGGRPRVVVPDTVAELLGDDDIRQMISDFVEKEMAGCESLIMLWKTKDGRVFIDTNCDEVSAWGLFFMGLQARGTDHAEED